MSLAIKFLIVLLLVLAGYKPVQAETLFKVAEAFNIRAVNGSLYPSGLLKQNRQLSLRPGINLIALEYEEVFESEDDDNFDIIKSDVFLLNIYLKQNTQYQQRLVKPHNAAAAKRYIMNPLFEVLESDVKHQNQKKVAFELLPLSSNLESFIVASTHIKARPTLDLSHPSAFKAKQNNQTIKIVRGKQAQSQTSRMLNYWWQRATPDERKEFLNSISN